MDTLTLKSIEIVEDNTKTSKCDEGFLRVKRLKLKNLYTNGTESAAYPCDIVERRQVDAVAIVLYEVVDTAETGKKVVRVLLRKGIRAPVYLRQHDDLNGRDEPIYSSVYEIVAGVLEDQDRGYEGVDRRAVEEAREEAGMDIGPDAVASLGGSFFPSPGITPEKVYLASCRANLENRGEAVGDGSVMEEGASVEILDLKTAIKMCRDGEIQDAKTEIALLRMADYLGYIPQLDCFVNELPEEIQGKYSALGMKSPKYC